MNSLFVVFENNEWCHFVVRIGSSTFISFYCALFRFFLFLSFFSEFFWYICQYLKQSSGGVPRFLSGVSSDELLHPFLVINLPGLVQFERNLSYILPPLASQNWLQQSSSVKLIYQFLYLINGYLFFRCLEKVFEEERNKNKKEIVEVL